MPWIVGASDTTRAASPPGGQQKVAARPGSADSPSLQCRWTRRFLALGIRLRPQHRFRARDNQDPWNDLSASTHGCEAVTQLHGGVLAGCRCVAGIGCVRRGALAVIMAFRQPHPGCSGTCATRRLLRHGVAALLLSVGVVATQALASPVRPPQQVVNVSPTGPVRRIRRR